MLKLNEVSERRLSRLLRHAGTQTAFYGHALAGVSADLPAAAALDLLPIIEKRIIRKQPLDFVSHEVAPTKSSQSIVAKLLDDEAAWENESLVQLPDGTTLVLEKTSGSTGTPLKLIKTEQERLIAGKAVWKLRRRLDRSARPAQLFPFEHAPLTFSFPYDLGDYSPHNVAASLIEIARRAFTWLHGHPQGLQWWAEIVLQDPAVAECLHLNYVESNGSPLSTTTRALIERAFRCPVVDNYNSREVWTVAFECRQGHLHVNDECLLVEIIDGSGKRIERSGEPGDIVLTSLYSYAMPLIRYALGDRVEYDGSKCCCVPDSPAIRFAVSPEEELILGTTLSGTELFSKVTRFIYGSFVFQYKEVRVVQTGLTNFDVWVGDFRGDPEEFRTRFRLVTELLLAPRSPRIQMHFVGGDADVFRENPRNLFVPVARRAVAKVHA